MRDDPGDVDKVIRSVRYLREQHPKKRKLAIELRDFRLNRQRMDYAALLEANLLIGAGVVEATCKTLVTQRLKRPGMRWSAGGGQAMLTLHSLIQCDRLKRTWDVSVSTYKRDIQSSEGSWSSRPGSPAEASQPQSVPCRVCDEA